jgi:hypothetical protein
MRTLQFLLLQLLVWPVISQTLNPAEIKFFSEVVSTLSSDSMKGRLPGTPEEKKSAAFIKQSFIDNQLKPFHKKKFIFPFSYLGPDSVKIFSAGNVIGKIETPSTTSIVISAHYDHIGFGKHHSNDPFSHAVHNGADDNASGVAMLIELARRLVNEKKKFVADIVFVSFSGEEDGLWGSQFFLNSKTLSKKKIIVNINLDMVGRLDQVNPIVTAESDFKAFNWGPLLDSVLGEGFKIERQQPQLKASSDSYIFLQAGIPSILFSTGITGDYHRPSDDFGKINFEGMRLVTDYLEKIILRLATDDSLGKSLKPSATR